MDLKKVFLSTALLLTFNISYADLFSDKVCEVIKNTQKEPTQTMTHCELNQLGDGTYAIYTKSEARADLARNFSKTITFNNNNINGASKLYYCNLFNSYNISAVNSETWFEDRKLMQINLTKDLCVGGSSMGDPNDPDVLKKMVIESCNSTSDQMGSVDQLSMKGCSYNGDVVYFNYEVKDPTKFKAPLQKEIDMSQLPGGQFKQNCEVLHAQSLNQAGFKLAKFVYAHKGNPLMILRVDLNQCLSAK